MAWYPCSANTLTWNSFKMLKIVIIGLGNPGPEYTNTRHNAGFICIDDIARTYRFGEFLKKGKLLTSNGEIGNFQVILVKPITYMNNSGEPLPEFLRMVKPAATIVVHDDIDLKLCDVRFKFAGSNAGHNGLKSLDQHISNRYWRIRVGVGRPADPRIPIPSFVLGRFTGDEARILAEKIAETTDNMPKYIDQAISELRVSPEN